MRKKTALFLIVLMLLSMRCFAATKRIEQLTSHAKITDDDLLVIIDDPASTKDTRQITYLAFSGNVYHPDYSETDQGADGNGKSAKSYIDTINNDFGTIELRHDSGDPNTVYTFTTAESIPSNIMLKIQHGAIVAGTLTIGKFVDPGPVQCFAANASITFSDGAIEYGRPEWFYTPRDGTNDDVTAFNKLLDTGIKYIKGSTGDYYFGSPFIIDVNGVTADGVVMNAGGVINALATFTGGDANGLIEIDVGCDYVTIKNWKLVCGNASTQYADYGIYAKGDSSHQEIHVDHVQIQYADEWGILTSCFLSEIEHARIAYSSGIYVGQHHASSSEGTNITLKNCYIVQPSLSTTTTAYCMDTVSGFNIISCASDYNNIYFHIDTSIGTILGCDGEYNRQLLDQDNVASQTTMTGCRFYKLGDAGSPTDDLLHYSGRVAIEGCTLTFVENGYTEMFNEASTTRQLFLRGNNIDFLADSTTYPRTFNENADHYSIEDDLYIDAPFVNYRDYDTIADNGDGGTAATHTLTPVTSFAVLNCEDPQGCTITMGETGIDNGQMLYIVNCSAYTCAFSDTSGVSELAGAFNMGQYDALSLIYWGETWMELNRSNN